MISEVETVHLTGQETVWDGTNLDEVQQVAGTNFIGVNEAYALVRSEEDGEIIWVRQGWTVARLDEQVIVFSSDVAPALLRRTASA